MLVHHRRRLARAAVAALVALATLAAVPVAHATVPNGLTLTLRETCGWLLRGAATPLRIEVRNDGSSAVDDVSLVPRLPDGFTSTVTRARGPVLPGSFASFHVSVTTPAGAPPGPARLRFDAVAGALGGTLEVDVAVVGRPAAPTAVTAVAHDATATVTWQPGPAQPYPGEREQRLYLVTASPGGARAGVFDGTTATVAGLTNGTAYTFTVSEWNHYGTTASAPSAPVVPVGVPGLVTGVAAIGSGTSRTVSWQAADPNGAPVEKYTVTAYPGGSVVATTGGTATSVEVTGLAEGGSHTFTVRATNAAGDGPESLRPGGPPAPYDGPFHVYASGTDVAAAFPLDPADPPAVDGWLVTLQPGGHEQYVPRDDPAMRMRSARADWYGVAVPGTTVALTVRSVTAAGVGAPRPAVLRTTADEAEPPVVTGVVSRDHAADVCFLGSWDRGTATTGYGFWHLDERRDVPPDARITPVAVPDNGLAHWSIAVFPADAHGTPTGPESAHALVGGAGPPRALAGAHATASGLSAHVTWDYYVAHHGDDATHAQVVASPGGTTQYVGPQQDARFDGLAPGTAYTFSVRLFDEHGLGPAAVTEPVTATYGPPGRVEGVTVEAAPGDPAAMVVRWQPAAPNGSPVTEYRVTYSGLGPAVVRAPDTSVTLRGLGFETPYDVVVQAWNAAGAGPASAAVTYATPPKPAPVVTVTAPPTATTAAAARLAYAAPYAESYDVRYRVARYDGGPGAYRYPAGWQATTATEVSVLARQGWAYCFGVRARDERGVVTDWTPDACTASPVDDTTLAASPGWTRRTSGAYYAGTISATATRGATLTRTNVRARRLALVATACAACGDVGVYLDGVLVRRVRLTAAATAYRRVVVVDLGAVRTGTVTLKVLSGRAYVDGLGVLPV